MTDDTLEISNYEKLLNFTKWVKSQGCNLIEPENCIPCKAHKILCEIKKNDKKNNVIMSIIVQRLCRSIYSDDNGS